MPSQSTITQLLENDPEAFTRDELVITLKALNTAYFETGESLASDEQYDALKQRLEDIEPSHPLLKAVGAPSSSDKVAVKLPIYMGSLDKVKPDTKDLTKY